MADRWGKYSDIVIEIQNEGIPVYRVQREFGDSKVKTPHRIIILPFSVITHTFDFGLFYQNPPNYTSKSAAPVHKQLNKYKNPASESDSSESDTELSPPHDICFCKKWITY